MIGKRGASAIVAPNSFFNALNREPGEDPRLAAELLPRCVLGMAERAHDGAIGQYPLPFNS
jgi:hypothetical protein